MTDTVSKHKKVKNVKQKLKLFRANEPMKSVLMWGINYSFSALNHVKPRAMLLKDDFKAHMKVKINNHLFNKENMPSRFKYKEYCPLVFKSLRDRFGVNKFDYWDSFTRHQPLWDSTRGKSGSKFLVTYNRQFVAKTITSEEVEQMHHMLEEYYSYIVKGHCQTLLPQYLGLYRLSVNDQETYILVMRNVFSPRLAIHKKFDLKLMSVAKSNFIRRSSTIHSCVSRDSSELSIGDYSEKGRFRHHRRESSYSNFSGGSAVDREANEKEKSKPLPTLKDADFLNDICKIYIGEESKKRLLSILESDIQFLQENNLIDYSLLIGIHDLERNINSNESEDNNRQEPSYMFEDKIVSAGDGLGTLTSQWPLQSSAGRSSIVGPGLVSVLGTGNLSAGDEDEDDDGIPIPEQPNSQHFSGTNLTPPDSPPEALGFNQPFTGELHSNLESYGIQSSSSAPRHLIYFVAIIDILTRYGMRKRTAQTYKTVKHGSEVSSVKPELYGRRLLDFVGQCVE